ncbi:hypothetical protein SLNSH_20550 [Alsobacter soli]|uniref:Uncharacterized protein n=1 Tax=Alsobacter soli TaxID=2109933 RepID=A0A2T1HN87_9HYPH|nr:hypothetical protein [Alsobacter soli]PSC03124.1 hypothetical protein SLNSH_20550 [Alsobacter soli]
MGAGLAIWGIFGGAVGGLVGYLAFGVGGALWCMVLGANAFAILFAAMVVAWRRLHRPANLDRQADVMADALRSQLPAVPPVPSPAPEKPRRKVGR